MSDSHTHAHTHTQNGGLGFVVQLLAQHPLLHKLHLLLIACDCWPLNPIHAGAAGPAINTGSMLFLPPGCWINESLSEHTHTRACRCARTHAHIRRQEKTLYTWFWAVFSPLGVLVQTQSYLTSKSSSFGKCEQTRGMATIHDQAHLERWSQTRPTGDCWSNDARAPM